jgi:hypothetical protein
VTANVLSPKSIPTDGWKAADRGRGGSISHRMDTEYLPLTFRRTVALMIRPSTSLEWKVSGKQDCSKSNLLDFKHLHECFLLKMSVFIGFYVLNFAQIT